MEDCSVQQKKRRIDKIRDKTLTLLSDDHVEVTGASLRNTDTGKVQHIEMDAMALEHDKENDSCGLDPVLYTKKRFGISDSAYHELSMLNPQLPRSYQLKKRCKQLNDKWHINKTAENTTGVQQSLTSRLIERVKHLCTAKNSPLECTQTICVKLTGDGTYMGSLHIVTFGFCLIDEGNVA